MEEVPLLKVTQIEGRGRALVAAKPLKGGQVILRDSAILLYSALPFENPSTSTTRHYCSGCFKTIPEPPFLPIPCSSCSTHFFCTQNCKSKSESSSHSPWVCQTLSRLQAHSSQYNVPHDLQIQSRFLCAAYNLALFAPSHFQNLLSMQGEASSQEIAAAQLLHPLILSLSPPPRHESFSLELAASLLAKDKLNAFGLMEPFTPDGNRSVRAYGLYPNAALFNHDCLPNACRFDYVDNCGTMDLNTDITIRLIHDVPQDREICLSYFPVNEKYASRQKRLVEDYGFDCKCDRCQVEASWSDADDDEYVDDQDEAMDEEVEEVVDVVQNGVDNVEGNDFPHAYFFARYMCDRVNCYGTLAPLAIPKSTFLECNVCGYTKEDVFGGE